MSFMSHVFISSRKYVRIFLKKEEEKKSRYNVPSAENKQDSRATGLGRRIRVGIENWNQMTAQKLVKTARGEGDIGLRHTRPSFAAEELPKHNLKEILRVTVKNKPGHWVSFYTLYITVFIMKTYRVPNTAFIVRYASRLKPLIPDYKNERTDCLPSVSRCGLAVRR